MQFPVTFKTTEKSKAITRPNIKFKIKTILSSLNCLIIGPVHLRVDFATLLCDICKKIGDY